MGEELSPAEFPEFAGLPDAGDVPGVPPGGSSRGGLSFYGNLSGNSGVATYDLGDGDDQVLVNFKGGQSFTYTAQEHGSGFVAELRDRLVDGAGACTWINQHLPGRGRARRFDPLTPAQRSRAKLRDRNRRRSR